jgi:hypothetical protein
MVDMAVEEEVEEADKKPAILFVLPPSLVLIAFLSRSAANNALQHKNNNAQQGKNNSAPL